jgi:pimeloyl-ACP methyl ester carboxylesterase
MEQKHELIPLRGGSFAMTANSGKSTRAVVFVHGWGGSPGSTWYHFQEQIDNHKHPELAKWWQGADLYFYNYESTRFSIAEHTEAFLTFLDSIFPKFSTSAFYSPRDIVRDSHDYEELFLIGHSLGGVVLREAILDRTALKEATHRRHSEATNIVDAHLRLFAPAMHGAKPSGWLGLAYHLLREIKQVQPFFKAVEESQIIRQLRSESDKLKRLRDETEAFAMSKGYRALVAHVVFGEKEQVVDRDKFRLDNLSPSVEGKDHTSICKPDSDYYYPFKFVVWGKDA